MNYSQVEQGQAKLVAQSMDTLFPFNLISLEEVDGELVEAAEPFRDLLSSFDPFLKYSYIISGKDTITIFKASSTRAGGPNQAVGVASRIGNGAVVFSPSPRKWDDPHL
jgi:hypothetical protein